MRSGEAIDDQTGQTSQNGQVDQVGNETAEPSGTRAPWSPIATSPRPAAASDPQPATPRRSFLQQYVVEEPATRGWRGVLNRTGVRIAPSDAERLEREDVLAVAQRWGQPRTVAVVNGKGGAGKALAVDEPVLTPHGYRPIGQLAVGDLVVGLDGLSYPVLGVYPQGERDLFHVTFTDGTTISADGEHLWAVHTLNERPRTAVCSAPECDRHVLARGLCRPHYVQRRRGRALSTTVRRGSYGTVERLSGGERVMTTAQLRDAGLGTPRPGRGVRHRFFVPVCSPVKLDPTALPLDPYLLGVLIGDGSLRGPSVELTTADQQIHDAVIRVLPPPVTARRHGRYGYRLTVAGGTRSNPLITALRQLELMGTGSSDKHVPGVYRLGDLDTRVAVLQGLLDTDGWVERGTVAGFTTVSARLADDVEFLAQSLGCVVTRSAPRAGKFVHRGEARVGQVAHSLRIAPPPGVELFRLTRKQSRMRQGQRPPYRAIASIEPAGRGEAVCISVASPDHLFLARGCVPTHNTPSTAMLSAAFARHSSGVLAWENNQTRGTLGWRTEHGTHDATLLDLLPRVPELMTVGAQSANLAAFTHHQVSDRYDVLRAQPLALAADQRIEPSDVSAIHRVASKYYRIIVMDSGNDESDPMWQQMMVHTDQLVVPTSTRDDHAEAGALLLEALAERDEHSRGLAQGAVVVVSQSDPKAGAADLARVAEGFATLAREVVTIPFDPAMVDGVLRWDALRPATRRAWLAAGAAVARGF